MINCRRSPQVATNGRRRRGKRAADAKQAVARPTRVEVTSSPSALEIGSGDRSQFVLVERAAMSAKGTAELDLQKSLHGFPVSLDI